MIIARATKADGEELLVLGFSDENIKRLTSGKPVVLKRFTHGDGIPDGWEIILMHGKTEEDMAYELRQHGLIGEGTTVFRDPRLGKDGVS